MEPWEPWAAPVPPDLGVSRRCSPCRRRLSASGPVSASEKGSWTTCWWSSSSEIVRFRACVRKWEGEQGHVLVVKLGMLVGPVGALGVGFVGQTPAFAGASGGRCASTSRVQAMVVGAMQSAGTLMAEYWRGDRVTSCARGARAPGEGPCALAEGRPVHLRRRDDR